MKYVLLLLLVACNSTRHNPINSGGLTWPVDSINYDTSNVYIFDSNPVFNLPYVDTLVDPDLTLFENDVKLVRQDTTAVVLLVGDTASIFLSGKVEWKKGYVVNKVYCCINTYQGQYAIYQRGEYKEFSEYLGPDCKPLPKNILIWLSK